MRRSVDPTLTVLALLAVYLVWGSTYLGMRFGLESFPPLLLGGIRFLIAGVAMLALLRWRGEAWPTRRQWWNAGRVGSLTLVGGVGLVAMAQDAGVGSGIAAAAVAIIPVWAALISGVFGDWPRRLEWVGLTVGLVGVLVLVQEGDLQSSPLGLVFVLIAPISWAFGSVWGTRLAMPRPLTAAAAQLFTAGLVLLAVGLVRGERVETVPSASSLLAVAYLIVFGSIVAYSAYVYLLQHTRPALATSYAYVNPAVAVLLGMTLGAEVVTGQVFVALPLILGGVAIVTLAQRRGTHDRDEPAADAEPEAPPLPLADLADDVA